MKKIIAFLVLCSSLLILVSCNKGPNIEVTLSNVTSSELELKIEVGNKRKVTSGTAGVYLYTNYGETNQKQIQAYTARNYEDTLTFTNLTPNTVYDIRVTCTFDGESGYEAWLGEFSTLEVETVEISAVENYNAIANNLGSTASYKLVSDLDFTNEEYPALAVTNAFAGEFDGNNHVIKNITINSNSAYIGLFGQLTGKIKNLTIENITINASASGTTEPRIGAVVGSSTGVLENVVVKGLTINFDNKQTRSTNLAKLGGLVGYQEAIKTTNDVESRIENCSVEGTIVNSAPSSGGYVGGLVGYSTHTTSQDSLIIKNCKAITDMTVSIRYGAEVGGLFGELDIKADMSDCYAKSTIVITNEYSSNSSNIVVGGLVGLATAATVTNVVSDSNISITTNASAVRVITAGMFGQTTGILKLSNSISDAEITITAAALASDKKLFNSNIGYAYLLQPTITNVFANVVTTCNGEAVDYSEYTSGVSAEGKLNPTLEEFQFNAELWQIVEGKIVLK